MSWSNRLECSLPHTQHLGQIMGYVLSPPLSTHLCGKPHINSLDVDAVVGC